MARLAQALDRDRAARNAAKAAFDQRLSQIRRDLDARGMGGRIADRLGEDARDMFDEAVEIADQHKGVVAGTVTALMIWIFRSPILSLIERMMGIDQEEA